MDDFYLDDEDDESIVSLHWKPPTQCKFCDCYFHSSLITHTCGFVGKYASLIQFDQYRDVEHITELGFVPDLLIYTHPRTFKRIIYRSKPTIPPTYDLVLKEFLLENEKPEPDDDNEEEETDLWDE